MEALIHSCIITSLEIMLKQGPEYLSASYKVLKTWQETW